MSTQAKIHCHNCGNDYYVYWSEMNKQHIVNCPHCDAKMDAKMWEHIIDAMGTVNDLNYHFRKYHEERSEDLFSVSIESIDVPDKAFRFE